MVFLMFLWSSQIPNQTFSTSIASAKNSQDNIETFSKFSKVSYFSRCYTISSWSKQIPNQTFCTSVASAKKIQKRENIKFGCYTTSVLTKITMSLCHTTTKLTIEYGLKLKHLQSELGLVLHTYLSTSSFQTDFYAVHIIQWR